MNTEGKAATNFSERNKYLDLDSVKFRATYSLQSNSFDILLHTKYTMGY